jgi:hypothetical protein
VSLIYKLCVDAELLCSRANYASCSIGTDDFKVTELWDTSNQSLVGVLDDSSNNSNFTLFPSIDSVSSKDNVHKNVSALNTSRVVNGVNSFSDSVNIDFSKGVVNNLLKQIFVCPWMTLTIHLASLIITITICIIVVYTRTMRFNQRRYADFASIEFGVNNINNYQFNVFSISSNSNVFNTYGVHESCDSTHQTICRSRRCKIFIRRMFVNIIQAVFLII